MPGTAATATVDTVATDTMATVDTVDTVDTVATMATEKGLQMPSQSPLLQLPLTPTLMLMPGTVATATADTVDTVATDMVATEDIVDIAATMATGKGLQMPSQSPLLQLTPTLMLMPGTATDTVATDTVATDTVATDMVDIAATMATEKGLQVPSQSPLLPLPLPLTPLLMLMPGTATTATDMGTATDMDTATMATDTDTATTAHMDMGVTGAKQANREVDSSSDCDFPSTLASISRACA